MATPTDKQHVTEPMTPTTVTDVMAFPVDDDDKQESGDAGGDSPGSDDEFFDSVEQQELSHAASVPRDAATAPTLVFPAPEGVRRVLPGVFSLRTGAPVLEPVTQLATPVTEDVAKQQQALLARLGGSVESALLRQQLQSAALVSDMQAFKAANPGCCLADFVRWYSPKDWVALDAAETASDEASLPLDGEGVWWFRARGRLSERMRFGPTPSSSTPHLWQQMWDGATPVPAVRQRRLFDPLHEAEKVFHDLETLSPHELFHQMLAGAATSALFALESALPVPRHALPAVDAAMRSLHTRCTRAVVLLDDALAESQVATTTGGRRDNDSDSGRRPPQEAREAAHAQLQVAFEMALDACWHLVAALERVEALVANARALLAYFPPAATVTGGGKSDSAQSLDPNIQLVNLLLEETQARERVSDAGAADDIRDDSNDIVNRTGQRDTSIAELLAIGGALRERVMRLVLLNPELAGPEQREYVLRCVSPRPFLRESAPDSDGAGDSATEELLEESPLVVNRMYAAFKKHTVRFALVLAESEF